MNMMFQLKLFCAMYSYRDITEGKPLALEVKGLEYMNDDPSMVDVLYAKVCVQGGSDK